MPTTTWPSARYVGRGLAGAGVSCAPVSTRAFSLRREDAHPGEREQRGREGDRDQHRDRDRRRADAAHQAEERDARHVERDEGDDDRRPREHHRIARGAVRERDRLLDRVPLPELPAVPVDDEQRVVDADRQPEHDAQYRGDRRHHEHVRERQRTERRDPHADERGQDRQPGRDQRAEQG